VAMRQNNTVYWLHGDHLGSASLTTNITGAVVSEMRYYPFGETRWVSGTLPTDRLFTGQRAEAGIGLYDYNARMYSPSLGRFISADTIVPSVEYPQSLNRYSYVYNHPINLTDPSGHCPICFVVLTADILANLPAYYGRSPDMRGIVTAVSYSALIEKNATPDVSHAMLGSAIAVQSQWCCGFSDLVSEGIQQDPSLGIAQLRHFEMVNLIGGGDANNPELAIKAMSKKIGNALDGCAQCTATDRFVVAGLAQNEGWQADGVANIVKNNQSEKGNGVNWAKYFNKQPAAEGALTAIRTSEPWQFFVFRQYVHDLLALNALGWGLPDDLNIVYLQCVASGNDNCTQ